MKKSILLALPVILVALVVLSACSGGPRRNPNPLSGGTIRPKHHILTTDDLIKYNPDGSIDMGQITLPNGEKIIIKWMPMTFKGAATEPVNSEYDLLIVEETEAIEKNPKDTEAYIRRAALYYDRGRNPEDLERAIQDCNEVLKIDNSEPAAYYIRGLASFMIEDYERALSDFWTILNIRDYMNRGINYILGQLYLKMNMTNEAIEMFEKVVSVDPGFADTVKILDMLQNR